MAGWAHGITPATTSKSIHVKLRSSLTNLEVTGVTSGSITASYIRTGGVRVAITVSALGAVDAAYSSGGWIQIDATNQPGLYRLDVPDAAFAAGADLVTVTVKAPNCFTDDVTIPLSGIFADLTTILGRLPTTLVSGRIDASVGAMANDVLTAAALSSGAVDKISADLLDELIAELGAGAPPVSPKVRELLALLYMAVRNKVVESTTLKQIHNDAGTVIATASVSDDNTTATKDEFA